MSPKVSIVMNCYNSARYLREAIDSIFAQTFTDWEIIFWDNRSTDDSAEIAKSYGEKIVYYLAETHQCLGAARSEALAKVSGDYVAFLDCDDMWKPEKLAKQVQCFESDPSIDFIYTRFEFISTSSSEKTLSALGPSGLIFETVLHRYPVGLLTVMMRRSVLDALDYYFAPELEVAQDFDLFMRILQKHKAKYISEVLATYRKHESNTSQKDPYRGKRERLKALENLKLSAENPSQVQAIQNNIRYTHFVIACNELLKQHKYAEYLNALRKDGLLTPYFLCLGTLMYIKFLLRTALK